MLNQHVTNRQPLNTMSLGISISNPLLPLPHPTELNFLFASADVNSLSVNQKNHTAADLQEDFSAQVLADFDREAEHVNEFTALTFCDEDVFGCRLQASNDFKGFLCAEKHNQIHQDGMDGTEVQELGHSSIANKGNPAAITELVVLPKNLATRGDTSVLRSWLLQHQANPYPTKNEKLLLSLMTNMSTTQISTWFANARRRLKKERQTAQCPLSMRPPEFSSQTTANPLDIPAKRTSFESTVEKNKPEHFSRVNIFPIYHGLNLKRLMISNKSHSDGSTKLDKNRIFHLLQKFLMFRKWCLQEHPHLAAIKDCSLDSGGRSADQDSQRAFGGDGELQNVTCDKPLSEALV